MAETDFGAMLEAVARHAEIWGDPNPRFRKPNELRWGSHGARSVVVDRGVWHDNEFNEGGGTIDLIRRELSTDKAGALKWLEAEGFISGDDRRQEPRRRGRSGPTEPQEGGREGGVPAGREYRADAEDDDPGRVTAEYAYTDEKAKPLFTVERIEFRTKPKTFRQKDPKGRYSVKGLRRVPYNLPAILAAIEAGNPVYIVEGEKDVENARDLLGVVATCNAGGAGKWSEAESKCLKDADVVWLPDNDDAGRGHVTTGALHLRAHAKRQRVVWLPDLDEKEDLTDWIDNGGSPADLEALVRESKDWTPEPPATKFGALTWEQLDSRPDEEHEFIVDDFFTAGDVSAIAGPSGSGKSFLAIDVGMKVAVAAIDTLPELRFFGRKIVAGGLVCYQAGEGSRGVKKRLRAFRKEFNIPPGIHLPFVLMTKTVDLWRDKDIEPFITEIKAWQAYYNLPLKMVFIDTLNAAIPGAEENSAKDMSTVLTNCKRIRDECGTHVCLVHHMNAGGTKMRGSTAIGAALDNVVAVIKDEATKIRTARLDKQKDEEGDLSFRFELKRIELGWDEKRNKQKTSCVCLEVGEKDAQARAGDRKSFKLADAEHEFFDALIWTLKNKGVEPPDGLTLSANIGCVVDFQIFRERFYAKTHHEPDEDDDRFKERAKKRMQRAGNALIKFGVISRETIEQHEGKKQTFVWWTHKPVQGFPKTPIEPPKSDTEETGLMGLVGRNTDAFETFDENQKAEEAGRSAELSTERTDDDRG